MQRKQIPFPLFNPNENFIVDPKVDFMDDFTQELKSKGLKIISEGKVAVFINLSGFHQELKLKEPRALHIPHWPFNFTILEFFMERIRGVGKQALKLHGKNYPKKREPILLFIEVKIR